VYAAAVFIVPGLVWRLSLAKTEHLTAWAAGKDVRVVCLTRAYQQLRGGYPDIVRGYQRGVALIADQIATVARRSVGGVVAERPVS
jgi:hypothetical protein